MKARAGNRGFTLVETMLGVTIAVIGMTIAMASFIMAIRALRTGGDALLLQREADLILNMKLAPQIRTLQNIVHAGAHEIVFQLVDPDTGSFVTRGFAYRNNELYLLNDLAYSEDPEALEQTINYYTLAAAYHPDVEVLGEYVEGFEFSYRDGGNNLVAATGDTVDDPTAIEIVDVRITLARDRQAYQITSSFIPIRQFL